MVKPENEYFLRFSLLLIRVGTPVLGHIVTWGLERQNTTLERFLTEHRDEIRKSTQLTSFHKNFLHPRVTQATDLSKWDISLLVSFANAFLKSKLKTLENKAVEKFRNYRNCFHAHSVDASMDHQTFQKLWQKVTLVISTITYQMETSAREHLLTIAKNLENERIDITSAIEEIKAQSRRDETLQGIWENLDSLRHSQRKLSKDFEAQKKEMILLRKDVADIKTRMEKTKIVQLMYGQLKVTVNTADILPKVERRLLDACNERISGVSEGKDVITEKIADVIKEIEAFGVKVERVEEGSVILVFRCISLSAILDLIDYFSSQQLRDHLDILEQTLQQIFQVEVILEAFIILEPLRAFVNGLKETENTSTLRFTMTCPGKESIEHVIDVFENGAASNSLNSLSEALSDEVGERVILETAINKEQMNYPKLSMKSHMSDDLSTVSKSYSPKTDFTASSDEIIVSKVCTRCAEEGNTKDASFFCTACRFFLCERCEKDHARFPLLKMHVLIDKRSFEKSATVFELGRPQSDELTEECPEHPGNVTEMFCISHNSCGCVVCIEVNHRSCKQVCTVLEIAREKYRDGDRYRTEESLVNVRKDIEQLKANLLLDKSSANNEFYNILSNLQKIKSRITERLNELERRSNEKVHSRYKTIADTLSTQIGRLDNMLEKLNSILTKIANIKKENKGRIFLCVQQAKKLEAEGRELETQIKGQYAIGKRYYELNYDLEETVNAAETLVELKQDQDDKAKMIAEFDVKIKSDICNVTSCCVLDDGYLVITDANNNRLKLLNKNYQVTKWCLIPGEPSGVCMTGPKQLAVSLYQAKKVQYVTIGMEMAIDKSFEVGDGCLRICCNEDELFLICTEVNFVGSACYMIKGTSHLRVYSFEGVMLRRFQFDEAGKHLFSNPCNLLVCSDASRIIVADFIDGVVVLDRQGQKTMCIQHKLLQGAFGISEDNKGQIYVCGRTSHNVLLFNKDGVFEKEVVRHSDGIHKPVTLTFLKKSSKFIVSCENSETMKVFKMST